MPFVSEQQRKFAFATRQPWAKEWAKHTPKGKLPKRVRPKKRRRKRR